MTKENIYKAYIKEICSNCKNKDSNDCEIRRLIDNTVKCKNYERRKQEEK